MWCLSVQDKDVHSFDSPIMLKWHLTEKCHLSLNPCSLISSFAPNLVVLLHFFLPASPLLLLDVLHHLFHQYHQTAAFYHVSKRDNRMIYEEHECDSVFTSQMQTTKRLSLCSNLPTTEMITLTVRSLGSAVMPRRWIAGRHLLQPTPPQEEQWGRTNTVGAAPGLSFRVPVDGLGSKYSLPKCSLQR